MMGGFGIGGVRMSCLRLTSTAEAPLLRPFILPFSLNFRRRLIRPLATSCSATATKNKKEKVIVISGPTGAGKSRLALELAKRLNGEIISADSVQVYRGLDVGSAKPSLSERQEVPHHLIDILHPSEDYSVGQFYEDGRQVTNDVLNRGRVPIVAGGTGLYLRWFIYGKPDVPKASREITSEVHSELADLQRVGDWGAAVHFLVKAGDPSAQSLATNDWYRLRRRLEIIKEMMEFCQRQNGFLIWVFCRIQILQLELLVTDKYTLAMGYLLKCREQGGQSSAQDFYAFLSEFQKASRNFAKRQMTWFRNEPIYHWIDASKPLENVLNFICDAYQDQNGNLRVPESLCMKKDMTNQREVLRLKAYRTKNRHFVGREDCTDILNWVRTQEKATGTPRLQWNENLDEFSYAR